MKTEQPFIIFFCILAFTCYDIKPAQAQSNTSDKQVISTLKEFYTSYISAFSVKKSHDLKLTLNSLKVHFCTKNLISKLEKGSTSGELDSDPFLNAQDSDTSYLKSLHINKVKEKQNYYVVSYSDNLGNNYVINTAVIKQKNDFKIDSLWYPKHTEIKTTLFDKKATRVIKDLYTGLILVIANKTGDIRLNNVKKSYCTTDLLKKLKSETEPEKQNPFLKSKNVTMATIQTLIIKEDADNPNLYTVSYTDSKKNSVSSHILVAEENSAVRVENVW